MLLSWTNGVDTASGIFRNAGVLRSFLRDTEIGVHGVAGAPDPGEYAREFVQVVAFVARRMRAGGGVATGLPDRYGGRRLAARRSPSRRKGADSR